MYRIDMSFICIYAMNDFVYWYWGNLYVSFDIETHHLSEYRPEQYPVPIGRYLSFLAVREL